jgi:hypothetical protein
MEVAPRQQLSRSKQRGRDASPTRSQVSVTRAVLEWYFRLYHRTRDDPGVRSMFEDSAKVGAFAVRACDLRHDKADALFRLLVATTMFQRCRHRRHSFAGGWSHDAWRA